MKWKGEKKLRLKQSTKQVISDSDNHFFWPTYSSMHHKQKLRFQFHEIFYLDLHTYGFGNIFQYFQLTNLNKNWSA